MLQLNRVANVFKSLLDIFLSFLFISTGIKFINSCFIFVYAADSLILFSCLIRSDIITDNLCFLIASVSSVLFIVYFVIAFTNTVILLHARIYFLDSLG